jgi:hypothetical protein
VSQSHDTAIWADHPTVSQKTVVIDQVIKLFSLLDVKAYTSIQAAAIKQLIFLLIPCGLGSSKRGGILACPLPSINLTTSKAIWPTVWQQPLFEVDHVSELHQNYVVLK